MKSVLDISNSCLTFIVYVSSQVTGNKSNKEKTTLLVYRINNSLLPGLMAHVADVPSS